MSQATPNPGLDAMIERAVGNAGRYDLDAMIDRAGSSDTFLQQAQDERRELAAQIQAAAKQAIADAPAPR